MGQSRTFEELAGKFNASVESVESGQRNALIEAANVGSSVMLETARGARTKNITTRRSSVTTSGSTSVIAVRYGPNPGWVAIQTSGTQPHFIGAHKGTSLRRQNLSVGGQRRSARAGSLLLNVLGKAFGAEPSLGTVSGVINIKGIGPKAYAFHPGTHGKHFAAKGIQNAEPRVINTYERTQLANLAKPFL